MCRVLSSPSDPQPPNPGELQRPPEPTDIWTGTLHLYVAFDWGDEIDLERARTLAPAEVHALVRRRRTPTSITFRPPPLRFSTTPIALDLPGIGPVSATGEATVFDFAAVSVGLHVPFQLPAAELTRLAGWLADPAPLWRAARAALVPLHEMLLPAIQKPSWQEDLGEEYIVFQLAPNSATPDALLGTHAGWLAGLLRLEACPLSRQEIAEALRMQISYTPDDLLVPDWASAVLMDQDCAETLQTMEFANLQLLEFRHIDSRLDASLATAYKTIHAAASARLPFWRNHARSLRALGELKVEANDLFERTENVLKLVGDQYLARVYRLLSSRLHLSEWEEGIRHKLEVVEGVYQVVSDQADTYRTEFLELVVIGLIFFEIVVALVRH
jgi:hypothetical protein